MASVRSASCRLDAPIAAEARRRARSRAVSESLCSEMSRSAASITCNDSASRPSACIPYARQLMLPAMLHASPPSRAARYALMRSPCLLMLTTTMVRGSEQPVRCGVERGEDGGVEITVVPLQHGELRPSDREHVIGVGGVEESPCRLDPPTDRPAEAGTLGRRETLATDGGGGLVARVDVVESTGCGGASEGVEELATIQEECDELAAG